MCKQRMDGATISFIIQWDGATITKQKPHNAFFYASSREYSMLNQVILFSDKPSEDLILESSIII